MAANSPLSVEDRAAFAERYAACFFATGRRPIIEAAMLGGDAGLAAEFRVELVEAISERAQEFEEDFAGMCRLG
jgi:hypothetical protein